VKLLALAEPTFWKVIVCVVAVAARHLPGRRTEDVDRRAARRVRGERRIRAAVE